MPDAYVPALTDSPKMLQPLRKFDENSVNSYLTTIYQFGYIIAATSRQERQALLGIYGVGKVNTVVTQMSQAISNPPTQAEVAAIQTKVNELVVVLNATIVQLDRVLTNVQAAMNTRPSEITAEG